jgi:hypothetical protein
MFGSLRLHLNEAEFDDTLALKLGFEITRSGLNLGIFGAAEAIAEATTTTYLLYVEDDCPLVTGKNTCKDMLRSALDDMGDFNIPIFSMRSRREPGDKFVRRARYEARFRPVHRIGEAADSIRPLASYSRRLLEDWRRPGLRACAIYAEEDPTIRHPSIIKRTPRGNWLTSSRHLNWSNNCVLVRTNFLRDVVLDRVRRYPAPITVNGHQDIEAALKRGSWWRNLAVPMGQSEPGPFTHKRLER